MGFFKKVTKGITHAVEDTFKSVDKGLGDVFHAVGIRGWVGDHPLESAAIAAAAIYTGGAALAAMGATGAAGAGAVTAGTAATTAGGATAAGVGSTAAGALGTDFAAEASAGSFASMIGGSSAGATVASAGMGGGTAIASAGGVGGATAGAFGGGIASVGGGTAAASGSGMFTAANLNYVKTGLQAVNSISQMNSQQQPDQPFYAPNPEFSRGGKVNNGASSEANSFNFNPTQSQVAVPTFDINSAASQFV